MWHATTLSPEERSWIDIESFALSMGRDTTRNFEVNHTILHSELPRALLPGDSIKVDFEFVHHVRSHFGRSGYRNGQYDIGQWYPKVVVYDERGWDNTPWTHVGEFYGEFGDFRVTIDLPESYIVGAIGTVADGDPGWEEVRIDPEANYDRWYDNYLDRKMERVQRTGRRKVTFVAENVHDFAWSASPHFVYEHGQHRDIDIHILYRASQGEAWHTRMLQQATRTLEWLEEKFGPYGYPQLSVIHGLLGGGMEYPMLALDGQAYESLAVHEIGHIYFYGMLANDEWDEAWLDEGFTTFQTRRYMEHRYGIPETDPDGMYSQASGYQNRFAPNISYEEDLEDVVELQVSGNDEPPAQPADSFDVYRVYHTNVYTKAALMLDMLEYVMGEEAFWAGMQDYFDTWKFKHVNESRFREIMHEHASEDLDWFFDQWLHSTGHIDYAISDYSIVPLDDDFYRVTVSIENHGTLTMPVEVEFQLARGDTIRKRWFSHDNQGEITFDTHYRIARIALDPDHRFPDTDRMNNHSGIIDYGEILRDYP